LQRVFELFCLVLLLMPGGLKGGVITFQFSGAVTQVPLDEVFGDINFGDVIQGSFSFDTAGADQIPADPATGSYTFSAPFGMTVAVGTHEFSTTGSLNIGILNSFIDQFTVLATSASGNLTLELLLQDSTGSVFSNDHLPSGALALGSFDQRDFHLDAVFAGGEVQADGRVTAIRVQGAPEPGALVAVASGLMALGGLAARRRFSQDK